MPDAFATCHHQQLFAACTEVPKVSARHNASVICSEDQPQLLHCAVPKRTQVMMQCPDSHAGNSLQSKASRRQCTLTPCKFHMGNNPHTPLQSKCRSRLTVDRSQRKIPMTKKKTKCLFCFMLDEGLQPSRTDRSR